MYGNVCFKLVQKGATNFNSVSNQFYKNVCVFKLDETQLLILTIVALFHDIRKLPCGLAGDSTFP